MSNSVRTDAHEDLLRAADAGAPLVNRSLGFQIPKPASPRPLRELPVAGRHDNLFAWLQAAMLPLSANDELRGWKDLMRFNAAFAPGVDIIPAMAEEVLRLGEMGEEELLFAVADAFDFVPARFPDPEAALSHTSVKIGHGWWELLALKCHLRLGRTYHRPLGLSEWSDSGFDEMLSGVLKSHFAVEPQQGDGALNMVGDGLALGMAFGSGDDAHDIDLARPIHPVVRGAAAGSIAFFSSLFHHRKPIRIADGSAAKMLFWQNELVSFCESVRRWSDIVVFVVPPGLQDIELRGWSGEQQNIVLTDDRVHELWPAVLAYCAGRLEPVLQSGRRVSIFMQCGMMTIPLGLLAQKMAQQRPGALVKCYDFGQVLDIACYPQEPGCWIGPWSQKPDVIDQIRSMRSIPFALRAGACEKGQD